jgi:membrane associated rhomboid family serine protease
MSEQQSDDTQATPAEANREPILNIPPVVVAIIAACCVIHLVRGYVLTIDQDTEVLLRAAFIPERYFYAPDLSFLTTPVSYAILHGSAAHLLVNMVWLAAFGSPLANRLHIARFILFWIIAGLAAAGLYWIFHPHSEAPMIGASGAISGMMGAAARFAFRIDRSGGHARFSGPALPVGYVLRVRTVVAFLAVWMIVNLITGIYGMGIGTGMQIAWEAHIGGFVVGFFGIPFFLPRSEAEPHQV